MNKNRIKLLKYVALSLILVLTSCKKDDDDESVPGSGTFKVNFSDNYFANPSATFQKMWLMVSDLEGNIVDFQEGANGKKIVFKNSNNKNEKVYYTEIYAVQYDNGSKYAYATSYLLSQVNEFNYKNTYTPPANLGTSKVVVTNLENSPASYDYTLSGGGGRSSMFENGELKLTFNQAKSPDNLFMSFLLQSEEIPRYKWKKGIEVGNTYTEDFNSFQIMSTSNVSLPDHNTVSFSIHGVEKKDDPAYHYIYNGRFTDSRKSVALYNPGSGFLEYSTFFSMDNGDEKYQVYQVGDIPSAIPASPLDISISANAVDNYSFNTTGDYDYYGIVFTNGEQNGHFTWTVYGPAGSTVKGSLPPIPAELQHLFLMRLKEICRFIILLFMIIMNTQVMMIL
jgi:hypothetical protein